MKAEELVEATWLDETDPMYRDQLTISGELFIKDDGGWRRCYAAHTPVDEKGYPGLMKFLLGPPVDCTPENLVLKHYAVKGEE